MSKFNQDVDKGIASLVDITEALLRGDYDDIKVPVIDTEGLLSNLTQKINAMVVNMKSVEIPLSNAGEQAPTALTKAQNVVELMAQSTSVVLNKSDKVTILVEELENDLSNTKDPNKLSEFVKSASGTIMSIKSALFDIIASQSYQDVARQKMEYLISDLNNIRDWLIEALVVLNIGKDRSKENVQKKMEILREVKDIEPASESLKQDLVDDLLAEFGF